MIETPFFFPGKNYQLFGVLHQPKQNNINKGYVFCHPFGEEKLWAHRVYVNFARELSSKGYTVLRFDYMGYGDSDGTFEKTTVDNHINDIHNAIQEIQRQSQELESVGLLGLRFGATLACVAGSANNSIDNLILWDPVVDCNRYMQDLIRINLTTQMAVYGKIIKSREDLIQTLMENGFINIDGYDLSGVLYEGIAQLDLTDSIKALEKKSLIAQIGRPNQKIRKEYAEIIENNDNLKISLVNEEPFWREIKKFYSIAPNLFSNTFEWLEGMND